MEWLNYHHLRYFWAVAREGGVAAASRLLHVSQPAISTQLRQLERHLGEPLFDRSGRRLRLTEAGRTVMLYADQIFALGRELLDAVSDRPTDQPLRVQAGVADAVAKQVSSRLLTPLLRGDKPVRLTCSTGPVESLCAELAAYGLDVVLADDPHAGRKVGATSHLLGQSQLGVFAVRRLAGRTRRGFPSGLRGQPFLLPAKDSELRRELDRWLQGQALVPEIVAEVDDSSLLKSLAADGAGLLFAPIAVANELKRHYGLWLVGAAEGLVTRYYALTVARRIKHPAVAQLLKSARKELFAKEQG